MIAANNARKIVKSWESKQETLDPKKVLTYIDTIITDAVKERASMGYYDVNLSIPEDYLTYSEAKYAVSSLRKLGYHASLRWNTLHVNWTPRLWGRRIA